MREGPVSSSGLLLIGEVAPKLTTMAPARELYQGPIFERRRAYAEASGQPWLVLSSRWGLVHPDELIAPYELTLGDQPAMFRRAWGRYVAEQLAAAVALERGMVVEVHADGLYLECIRSPLQHLELVVLDGVDAGSFTEPLVG